ncbi:MAG: glutamine-hydrolyzing GMP synthase, partial [Clostridia bacterium]
MKQDMIVILDLGSESNSALAREIRAFGVYSEIYPHDITLNELEALKNTKGIILNGGKNDVIDGKKIAVSDDIFALNIPVVAIDCQNKNCKSILPSQLKDFVFNVAKCEPNWNMQNFIDDQVESIRKQLGGSKVLLALSGGVDSSVVAALLIKAIGDKLTCVHVNHGLLRKGEPEEVIEVFQNQMKANLVYVNAVERFLGKLAGVSDPEQKRKIIGAEFIRVFEEEARKLNGI